MANVLEQLKGYTTVVADTGNFEGINTTSYIPNFPVFCSYHEFLHHIFPSHVTTNLFTISSSYIFLYYSCLLYKCV